MPKYGKNYSIEWGEECEADNIEEAEDILDAKAKEGYPIDDINMMFEVEEVKD